MASPYPGETHKVAQGAEFGVHVVGPFGEPAMSKRVYEVARELGLSTNEVIRRLNDAGVEVKSYLAVVEDPVYDKVFDDD
jgi:hypothetical protein